MNRATSFAEWRLRAIKSDVAYPPRSGAASALRAALAAGPVADPLELGLDGAPDVLRAVEGPFLGGRIRADSGDGLVVLVASGPDGVRSQSVQPFGAATGNPGSPHYADQAPLFAAHRTQPVWMDEREIRAHLEPEYRPGEE
jgi:hypothetical protein